MVAASYTAANGNLPRITTVQGFRRSRRTSRHAAGLANLSFLTYPDITASTSVAKMRSLSMITRNASLTMLRVPMLTGSIRAHEHLANVNSTFEVGTNLTCRDQTAP
jgi:hypothetical protein